MEIFFYLKINFFFILGIAKYLSAKKVSRWENAIVKFRKIFMLDQSENSVFSNFSLNFINLFLCAAFYPKMKIDIFYYGYWHIRVRRFVQLISSVIRLTDPKRRSLTRECPNYRVKSDVVWYNYREPVYSRSRDASTFIVTATDRSIDRQMQSTKARLGTPLLRPRARVI